MPNWFCVWIWALSDLLSSVSVLRACQTRNNRQPGWLASREWVRVWKEALTPASRAYPWEGLATTIPSSPSLWFHQACASGASPCNRPFPWISGLNQLPDRTVSSNQSLKHRPGGGSIYVHIWFFWAPFSRTDSASDMAYVDLAGPTCSEHWHLAVLQLYLTSLIQSPRPDVSSLWPWNLVIQTAEHSLGRPAFTVLSFDTHTHTQTHTHTHTHTQSSLSLSLSLSFHWDFPACHTAGPLLL